jgi:CubicO group peptidase (beta-lactamase class C family)
MSESKAPEAQATEKTVVEQLNDLFAPWNRTDAPGLVVGVVKDGEVLYRRGFGMASLESCVANAPKTRMRIGSTSKHFTSLLALLLAEDGKLDLDAQIRTYIPELTGLGGDPTLRQLLQHRGGARCYLDVGFIAHGMNPTPVGAALAAQARQGARNFAPGEAMIYNNGGYHLVSIAIERVGGASFESQLAERLFAPLDMSDTASIPTDYEITPGIATLHIPLPGGRWRRGLFPSEEVRGEGAIVSTIDDMLRWTAHLRSRDKFGAPDSWAAMTTLPVYADGSVGPYALGLMLGRYRGLPVVHHNGGVLGGTCQMLTLPEDGVDVVILANGAPAANVGKLAEQVVDIILADKVGAPPPTVPSKDYEPFLGDWWSPETGMIYGLVDEEGLLKLHAGMPYGLPIEPEANGRLVSPAMSTGAIGFNLDPAKPEVITISFGGQSAHYRKIAKEDGDVAAFGAEAGGRYASADADAAAVIALDGERLVIRVADQYGRIEANMIPAGSDVAYTTPISPNDVSWWAISLTRKGGAVTGFRINTVRTRNLEFTRV